MDENIKLIINQNRAYKLLIYSFYLCSLHNMKSLKRQDAKTVVHRPLLWVMHTARDRDRDRDWDGHNRNNGSLSLYSVYIT